MGTGLRVALADSNAPAAGLCFADEVTSDSIGLRLVGCFVFRPMLWGFQP
jgi:hypothetical protein